MVNPKLLKRTKKKVASESASRLGQRDAVAKELITLGKGETLVKSLEAEKASGRLGGPALDALEREIAFHRAANETRAKRIKELAGV